MVLICKHNKLHACSFAVKVVHLTAFSELFKLEISLPILCILVNMQDAYYYSSCICRTAAAAAAAATVAAAAVTTTAAALA